MVDHCAAAKKFNGKWQVTKVEGLENLKEEVCEGIGVPPPVRAMLQKADGPKPCVTFCADPDRKQLSIKMEKPGGHIHEMVFSGPEHKAECTLPNGKKVTSCVKMEGEKMIECQNIEGFGERKIVREINGDCMTASSEVKGVCIKFTLKKC